MRKLNRNANTYRTNLGTKVTESKGEITLETPKASVTPIGKANREWLDTATRSVAAYEVLA